MCGEQTLCCHRRNFKIRRGSEHGQVQRIVMFVQTFVLFEVKWPQNRLYKSLGRCVWCLIVFDDYDCDVLIGDTPKKRAVKLGQSCDQRLLDGP